MLSHLGGVDNRVVCAQEALTLLATDYDAPSESDPARTTRVSAAVLHETIDDLIVLGL